MCIHVSGFSVTRQPVCTHCCPCQSTLSPVLVFSVTSQSLNSLLCAGYIASWGLLAINLPHSIINKYMVYGVYGCTYVCSWSLSSLLHGHYTLNTSLPTLSQPDPSTYNHLRSTLPHVISHRVKIHCQSVGVLVVTLDDILSLPPPPPPPPPPPLSLFLSPSPFSSQLA